MFQAVQSGSTLIRGYVQLSNGGPQGQADLLHLCLQLPNCEILGMLPVLSDPQFLQL